MNIIRRNWIAKIFVLLVCASILATGLITKTPQKIMVVNGHRLYVRDSHTPKTREEGLSGVDYLPQNQGMLFSYDRPGIYCYWMKDMKIPLDMIWLDSSKKVVNIQRDVTPDTYPQEFCPRQRSQYVLEVNSGLATSWDIEEGNQLQF